MTTIGNLQLYAKDGLFYKEMLELTSVSFSGHELSFLPEVAFIGADVSIGKQAFIPLEVDACTEYVTGSFDLITRRNVAYDGRLDVAITVWLLVEESAR